MAQQILNERSNGLSGKKRITVFTPAYNRAHTIEKLYQALQRQSFRDFEWVVVDDGSSDNTEALFSQWIRENQSFRILYIKQANGGKHRAFNLGVMKASGEIFYTVDSDDYPADDSLSLIDATEKTIPPEKRAEFIGICGLKSYFDQTTIGTTFTDTEYLDIVSLDSPKYHITGDRAGALYTELLKKYPFPEFEGENFLTECVVWDRMSADGYKLRFFNRTMTFCEYRKDGLTQKGNTIFIKNPRGYALYLVQSFRFGRFTRKQFLESCFVYYSELHDTLSFRTISEYLSLSRFILLRIIIRFYVLRTMYNCYMSLPPWVHNFYHKFRSKTGISVRPVK